MKKYAVLLAVIAILIGATIVYAAGNLPEGVQVFELPEYGLVCVLWPDGSGDCYCPCETGLCETPSSYATPTDKPRRDPTATPQDPTPTPQEPTSTPVTPEPTDKVKCNSGRGNGSEGDPDCDPGNSGGHNHGGD